MTEENRQWSLGGEDVDQIPRGARALAEQLLTEADGDAVAALVAACCVIGAMRSAVSRGLVRNGSPSGVDIAQVLDVFVRSELPAEEQNLTGR
ncbi:MULTISPECIES: hypothetical protein [unclassified Mesorhizobium]|uniref:hypothetical protein n=1 Tax=unclassified Mesorhizobium TaxID=325217 RepID=UPI0003CF9C21|nr:MULTISPECIES: hypothetical protein [unclassified Mesorhizobium]ESY48301.1 hypothetical protein X745_28205 [Mesorhizobium sp. LNJC374B00]ESY50942.1 hypothetical protein X744_31805 [Mesorhizobium sp. LNJC372A00]WJI87540.1 hypothetical protein NLY42_01095 [Mesorhizobium sp. C372A]